MKFFCRSNYLVSHPRAAGVSMTSVSFPSPHPSSFSVPPRTKHGYPQVKLRISQKFGLQNDSSINLYTCILVINKLKEMKVREDIIVWMFNAMYIVDQFTWETRCSAWMEPPVPVLWWKRQGYTVHPLSSTGHRILPPGHRSEVKAT